MHALRSSTRRQLDRAREALPAGRTLGGPAFAARHRGLLVVLWLHVPALTGFALLRGYAPGHALLEASLVAVPAAAATAPRLSRALRSAAAALGLVVASSVLVHLWDGAIEAHFHFFVVLSLLALYQAWLPYLTALVFVVVEHGTVGLLAPGSVYAHEGGTEDPWRWALVHGAFVLASSVGNVLSWRLTEHEALHDGLTGLPNRRLFVQRLEARLRSRPTGTTVLFLDLDGFKEVNDRHGHDVGDALLVAVAERLTASLRSGDQVARLGGDEFAVLLHACTSEAEALPVAERLVQALTASYDVDGRVLAVGASIGLSRSRAGTTALSLLREADLAMYDAKRSGGGRWSTCSTALDLPAPRPAPLTLVTPRGA